MRPPTVRTGRRPACCEQPATEVGPVGYCSCRVNAPMGQAPTASRTSSTWSSGTRSVAAARPTRRRSLPSYSPDSTERTPVAGEFDARASSLWRIFAIARLHAAANDTVDIAIVSAGVLAVAAEPLGEARVLAPGSYYAPGTLVSVVSTADPAEQRVRIAIDHDSPDHVALTHAPYPLDAGYHRYIEHPFPDVPAAVLRGDVDAGIWHRGPTTVPLDLVGIGFEPLTPAAQNVWTEISAAALASSPSRPELRAVLDAACSDVS